MGLKDLNTRFFVIGTKLHNDDLPSRLIDEIDTGKRDGKYLIVPIIENNKITWPGKYPDFSSIETEKRKIGNRIAWEREFMLNLVSPEEQLIKTRVELLIMISFQISTIFRALLSVLILPFNRRNPPILLRWLLFMFLEKGQTHNFMLPTR